MNAGSALLGSLDNGNAAAMIAYDGTKGAGAWCGMSPANWEELGWIEVDVAGVVFCIEENGLSRANCEATRVVEDGAVYQATMEDCPLPARRIPPTGSRNTGRHPAGRCPSKCRLRRVSQ